MSLSVTIRIGICRYVLRWGIGGRGPQWASRGRKAQGRMGGWGADGRAASERRGPAARGGRSGAVRCAAASAPRPAAAARCGAVPVGDGPPARSARTTPSQAICHCDGLVLRHDPRAGAAGGPHRHDVGVVEELSRLSRSTIWGRVRRNCACLISNDRGRSRSSEVSALTCNCCPTSRAWMPS